MTVARKEYRLPVPEGPIARRMRTTAIAAGTSSSHADNRHVPALHGKLRRLPGLGALVDRSGPTPILHSLHRRAGRVATPQAPVAQLDRAMAYGAIGWGFESLQA